MAKYLRCFDNTGRIDLTVGQRYEIVGEEMSCGFICYAFFDDAGDRATWPIETDHEGESYRTCFTLEEAEELTNVTVLNTEGSATLLPDEAIGGVEREYTEVKRKAAVGERIKNTVKASDMAIGYITEVYDHDCDGLVRCDDAAGVRRRLAEHRYVVLEPTDIVRIDGNRYRLVERKANGGELVIVTKTAPNYRYYSVGNMAKVISAGNRDIQADFNGFDNVAFNNSDGKWYVGSGASGSKYSVLEPLKTQTAAPDLAQEDASLLVLTRKVNEQATQISGLTDAVAKLTLQLKVAREDIVLIEEGVRGDIERLERHTGVEADVTVKSSRDDVIAKAKRDIESLKVTHHPTLESYYVARNLTRQPECNTEFIENREKRTVVCLLRKRRYSGGGAVVLRGIAKCAPGECFNVHIGRAIALRRALGLEVPAEYTNAPAPSEPRVGDVVTWDFPAHTYLIAQGNRVIANFDGKDYTRLANLSKAHVIDDSRENDAESEVKEKREPAVGDRVLIVDPNATNIGYAKGLAESKDAYIGEIDSSYEYPYLIITRDTGARIWSAREAFEEVAQ